MTWLYVACALFGWAFVVPLLLGGLASDVDVDLDVGDAPGVDGAELTESLDASSVEGGTDALEADGADAGSGAGSPWGDVAASVVSFRSLVFFSAFFGSSGLVFTALDYSVGVTLATAVLIGGVAVAINAVLFGLVKSSQATSQLSDDSFRGRSAAVVLPIEPGRRGRVRIDLSDQPHYMVARSYDDRSSERFDVGAPVVVVAVENGTALVASLSELESDPRP